MPVFGPLLLALMFYVIQMIRDGRRRKRTPPRSQLRLENRSEH